jgi:hypothetical protein
LIAVARQDHRVAVRQLLGEAWTTADRLGQERNDFWTAFGPPTLRCMRSRQQLSLATRARSCAR